MGPLFAEAPVLTLDPAAVIGAGVSIAGGIIGAAKILVSYLSRKDEQHQKQLESERKDCRETQALMLDMARDSTTALNGSTTALNGVQNALKTLTDQRAVKP